MLVFLAITASIFVGVPAPGASPLPGITRCRLQAYRTGDAVSAAHVRSNDVAATSDAGEYGRHF